MSNLKIISVLAILAFSTIMPAMVFAAPQGVATSAADWHYVNKDSWAQNYSPITSINRDNVGEMEVKWIFPIEGVNEAPAAMELIATNQGTTTPPVVANGNVFITTNWMRTYGIDGETGKMLWSHDYEIDVNATQDRLPMIVRDSLNRHLHGFRYWEGGNSLLISGQACDFYGVDADTGEESFWVKDLCLSVPGNLYDYKQGTSNQASIGTYEAGRQFIFILPGRMHSTVFEGDARHATLGVDMDTHATVWRVFSYPPHGVLSKDWALQECDTGFFRDIPCSTVAAQAPENLEWDWSRPNEAPDIYGGVTANWGQLVVDEDTGLMYTQTGNQGPYTYIGTTPGPRLYGSTLMAIDMDTGQRTWWSQPMPRDPYDYDCNWSGILADHPDLGKIYMKGCKEGLLHILDAATGAPIHLIDLIPEQVAWGQVSDIAERTYEEGGIRYHTMDPLSFYDMREMEAPDGSPYCGDPCHAYPYWYNGMFGTDMSYDPETGVLFHYSGSLQTIFTSPRPPYEPGDRFSQGGGRADNNNVSIVARNVASGEVLWHWFFEYNLQRSAMIVTPDLLYVGFIDGFIRFFDTTSGEILHELNVGSDIKVGMTTGQDSNGDQKIFAVLGVGGSLGAIGPTTPGTLISVGLSERAEQAITVTSTSTSVSTSTIATTNTVSVTSEVEVGISSTVTYAAIAVAVIAVIAAAVLTQRKS